MHGTYEDKDKYYRYGDGDKSAKAKPIPGPENPGPPASMRKALAKKSMKGGTGVGLPKKNTRAPGSR